MVGIAWADELRSQEEAGGWEQVLDMLGPQASTVAGRCESSPPCRLAMEACMGD